MNHSGKKHRVCPCESCIYEFELIEGEQLKGLISSSCEIDIYFVNNSNFSAWLSGQSFNHECCKESVSYAEIHYSASKEGTWYLLIENNGKKTANIEIMLNVSS